MPRRPPLPWEREFLAELEKTYNVSASAKKVGRRRNKIYEHRDRSKRFKNLWDNIMEAVRDSLEASTLEKAINGWLEPTYKDGKIVSAKRVFSPGLAIFMLKCHRPERYNIENQGHDGQTAHEVARRVRMELLDMNKVMDINGAVVNGAGVGAGGGSAGAAGGAGVSTDVSTPTVTEPDGPTR